MLIKTISATLLGLSVIKIEVEADSMQGKPNLTIIGLPEKALEEARERISNALSNCGIRLKCKKTVVNLAPADLRKTGSQLELAIAVALWQLTLQHQFVSELDIFFGELSLDGSLRAIKGALSLVLFAKQAGFKRVFLPADNCLEVSIVDGITIYPLTHLKQLLDFLSGEISLSPLVTSRYQAGVPLVGADFAHVIGQTAAKRCLEIAAAGAHNLLLSGVPGSGKSLLAECLPSILPPLTQAEAIDLTKIYSIAGLASQGLINLRPFRSPHHTISTVGLIGGSSKLSPGEISLAHQGILFLDELAEFRRDCLEALRQPLETGEIAISRASGQSIYPAHFTLVAATNPCPCGFFGSRHHACHCSPHQLATYQKKLSGPILDRLDLRLFVSEVDWQSLSQVNQPIEDSATVRGRVVVARSHQRRRYQVLGLTTNSQLTSHQVRQYLSLSPQALTLLQQAARRLQLSARSYFKIIKVARTIADLESPVPTAIQATHLAESLAYRQLAS